MSDPRITIGVDRFLAKRWADYAYELRSTDLSRQESYKKLKDWLSSEIKGKEVAAKTASQLKRLWLAEDQYMYLRNHAIELVMQGDDSIRSIIHYGMAINVFPFYRDLGMVVGRLVQLQGDCQANEVKKRLLEIYGTPSTIRQAVSGGLQTLIDWGLLIENKRNYTTPILDIENVRVTGWFIQSLLYKYPGYSANLTYILGAPEMLGITISDVRTLIRESNGLHLERNGRNEEVVFLNNEV